MNQHPTHRSLRRDFLRSAGGGAGMIALASLLSADGFAGNPDGSIRQPHFRPRAKRIIWLFMHGGPSQVDLFDPKPDLVKYAGQPLPDSFGSVMTRRKVANNPLLGPVRPFRPRGQSGLPISDFLPHLSTVADDLCVIRSLHGDSVNHPQSVYQMNTGSILMGHPSFGSWLAYGLGSENEDMPAFVVLPDPGGGLKGGPSAWGNGYLPATYQGTTMRPGKTPILNLAPPSGVSDLRQRSTLDFIQQLNQNHLVGREQDDDLAARIDAYELAFRMQSAAPEAVDFSQESAATLSMYGIDDKTTRDFGERCLLARRMIQRGVRMVQVYSGDTNGWDAHQDVDKNHSEYCAKTDKPVTALLKDLKRSGLLDDTLVVWCGEFGRMPMSEQGKGRDHNPWGYCGWIAGAGISGGRAYGATDEVGLRAAEDRVHVNEFHATLLHLMGLDHRDLTYFHNGLDERLTGPSEVDIVEGLLS
ncbi:DUF1501 domain-containing protein [Stieleria sp. ICT_E10.1]|uniref:DUF1501 domain-containing protein n=1 Tax=Stieleria sedimenti TaxID=2976331 RepID=UPI0021806280|nr:DUF1501 domain-containing protein [Stieleria sedimenti]MCS7471044.1 DUF1501 domain-containing protein [Stieleria sedimenti]